MAKDKKPRSPGHQARRNDAAKRIKKAYRTSKAQAADYGLTKPKDKIASGKFAADLTKKDIANDRKYDIKNRQNTRKIRTESRAQKKSGKPVELNIKKTIDTARKQMQWDLKKTDKAMGEIVKKTSTPYDRALGKQISKTEAAAKRVAEKTTPAQRAIGKQRVAARRAKLAAKRAADTRTPAQVSNDLVKSTARLKNKTARRKLSRNTEGKKNIHKPQKVGKAANTPRAKPPGGGMKGATNLRHLTRMTPVGAAVTMGEIAYRLNDTTSKGRSTGGRSGKAQRFKSAQQQDKDRANAKHEPKEN